MAPINSLSSQQTHAPIIVVMVSTAAGKNAATAGDAQTEQLANALFGKNQTSLGMSQSMDELFSGNSPVNPSDYFNVVQQVAGLDSQSLSKFAEAVSTQNKINSLVSSDPVETDILSQAIFKKPANELMKNSVGEKKPTDKKDLENKLNDLLSNDPTKPLADNQDVMDMVNNANPSDIAEVIAKVATGSKFNNSEQKATESEKPADPPVEAQPPAPPPVAPPSKPSETNRSEIRGGGGRTNIGGVRTGMGNASQQLGRMGIQPENPDNVTENNPSNQETEPSTPVAEPPKVEQPVAAVVKTDPPKADPPKADPPPAGDTSAAAVTLTQEQLDKLPKLKSEVKTAFEQAQGPLHSALKATQDDLVKAGFGNISASDLLNGTAKAK